MAFALAFQFFPELRNDKPVLAVLSMQNYTVIV